MCLDNYQAATRNGNKIDLYTCNGTGAQKWTYENDELVNVNGKCLKSSYDGIGGRGATVVLWTCDGDLGELFWYTATGEYVNHGNGLVLNDPAFSTRPATQQIMWTGVNSRNENYAFPAN